MKNKTRRKMIYFCILFIPIVLYFAVAMGKGYYPMPMGIKKLYYVWKIERNSPVSGPDNVIDKDFCFYQDGYFTSKEIKSSCSLPHILSLAWAEPNSPVPLDYTFQGKLCIEIYKEEKLLYSHTTSSTVNQYEYGVQGKPSKVYAIELLRLPFPLKGKPYKDIRVQVTVIEPDVNLSEYISSAVLSLVPDLRL